MRKTGQICLLEAYESDFDNWNEKLTRKLIRTISQYLVSQNKGHKPSPKIRRLVANCIQSLFPRVFPNIEVLLASNSNYGKFGKALSNAVTGYEKSMISCEPESENEESSETENENEKESESDTDEMEIEDENDELPTESGVSIDDETMKYLQTVKVSSSEIKKIEDSLSKTFDQRREWLMKGDNRFMFNIFFEDWRFVKFDFDHLFPNAQTLQNKLEILTSFVQNQTSTTNIMTKTSNLISSLYESIIYLLGKTAGGCDAAHEKLFKIMNGNTSTLELENLFRSQENPIIIIRQTDPPQFLVSLDGRIMGNNDNSFMNFHGAFDCLFKTFYVFHLKFPIELKKFFSFFACAIYEISSDVGRSHLLLDFIDKFKTYEEELDTNNDFEMNESYETGFTTEPEETGSDESSSNFDSEREFMM